jgi:hypothetical protein
MDRRALDGSSLSAPRELRPGHLTSIAKFFKAACINSGLDVSLVPYLAKHAFGTVVLRATGNPFAVMKAMGHLADFSTPFETGSRALVACWWSTRWMVARETR